MCNLFDRVILSAAGQALGRAEVVYVDMAFDISGKHHANASKCSRFSILYLIQLCVLEHFERNVQFIVSNNLHSFGSTGWVRKKYHWLLKKHYKKYPDVLWLKYVYSLKAFYVLCVLWKNEIVWKFRFQDMSGWTLLHFVPGYFPRNLPLHETGFLWNSVLQSIWPTRKDNGVS